MEENNKTILNLPEFTGRNVPITELSKAIGKDPQFIRIGLQKGILKLGSLFGLFVRDKTSYL